MIKFLLAIEATRPLNEDKWSGALELLLATPLGERQIAFGHSRALKASFRGSLILLIGLNAILQITAMVNGRLHLRSDGLFVYSSLLWTGLIWAVFDFRSIRWFGMYYSLTAGTHLKAAALTFGKIVLLPWVPMLILLAMLAAARADEETVALAFLAWAGLGALVYATGAPERRWRLLKHFRELTAGAG